jgi:Mg2+ and Co2+ transporter CorA
MLDKKTDWNEVVSYHIFCFPFRWDCFEPYKTYQSDDYNYRKRTSIDEMSARLADSSFWEKINFAEDAVNHYNDLVYYYDFAKDAIFEDATPDEYVIVKNYHRKDLIGASYEIKLEKGGVSYAYALEIDKVRLNIYESGIGMLSFFLKNKQKSDIEDILRINDYGRRLYPQFLDNNSDNPIKAAQNSFLAKSITIKKDDKVFYEQDFQAFKHLVLNKSGSFNLLDNHFLQKIFGISFRADVHEDEGQKRVVLRPSIDDRMFVLCWYGNNEKITQLHDFQKDEFGKDLKERNYQSVKETDDWMQYIFIDNGGNSCQSDRMQEELLKKHTYDRWIKYKTLYGVTRYSLVMLSEEMSGEKPFAEMLVQHLRGRYFELAQLSLMQRASMLRFSGEITDLVGMGKVKMNQDAKEVYDKYIRFVNKLYFREATPQEQGIELYDMLNAAMRTKDDIKALDSEIEEVFNFLNLEENEEQTKQATQLSKLAALFLPATLITGIFGMNIFNADKVKSWLAFGTSSSLLGTFILMLLTTFLVWIFVDKIIVRLDKTKSKLKFKK